MGEDFIWKMNKNEKTKAVVWDSKMIAMKPEKMFWTAEIELYRWVMSNGPYGYKKNLKMVSMFLDFGAEISTRYCWQVILWCFHVRGGSESCNFGPQNSFLVKFWSKTFFWIFIILVFDFFCIFLHIHFLIFLTFANFVEKIIFWWWFPLFFFNFGSKILPEPPL